MREIIETNPAALAYDFRHFFGLSYQGIGTEVTYLEAIYLVSKLLVMPNSWLAAERNDWKYPVTHEWMMLAHTHDLHHQVAMGKKKIKPIPKPWPEGNTKQLGNTAGLTNEQVIAALHRMNSSKES